MVLSVVEQEGQQKGKEEEEKRAVEIL